MLNNNTFDLTSSVDVSCGVLVKLVNAPLHDRVKHHLTRGKYGALEQIKVIRIPGEIRCIDIQGSITYE